MIKWLFEVLIGWPWCWHKWETIRTTNVRGKGEDGQIGTVGHIYALQCKRCGDIKHRIVGP